MNLGDLSSASALPSDSGWLAVGGGHHLYWETSGNPDGVPVVYLHGGPGAGSAPIHRHFFDPLRHRVILFDQRGCGRSRPYADLTDNTTAHLVEDLEALRQHLGVERWIVFGGSWGATLAVAYACRYRPRLLACVLRGVFLFRPPEVDWFLSGMGMFFPQAAARFRAAFAPTDPVTAQDVGGGAVPALLRRAYALLTDPDPAVHLPAAQVWTDYEDACARLIPPPATALKAPPNLAMARIEAHYMLHDGFLREAPLLGSVAALAGLPCVIVQGRYDVICPPVSAWELHQAWSGSRLWMIADGGHSAFDPAVREALVCAMRDVML